MVSNEKHSKGFTLIEIAIVVIIGGLLIVSLSNLLLTYIKQSRVTSTENKIEIINEALQLFLNRNGRYPCPARLNAPLDNANFGVETGLNPPAAPDCNGVTAIANAISTATGRNSNKIVIGAIPVRTLNLPDDYIADAWGGRFTYAVTAPLATPNQYDGDEGGISVVDSVGNSQITPQGSAHYVVVSHGANNMGATLIEGVGNIPCDATTQEGENCDNNDVFRNTLLIGAANNANLYDDMIAVNARSFFDDGIPQGAIIAVNPSYSICPPGWTEYLPAQGKFIIGGDNGLLDPQTGAAKEGGQADINIEITYPGGKRNVNPAAIGGSPFVENIEVEAVFDTPGDPTPGTNYPPYIALLYCEKT